MEAFESFVALALEEEGLVVSEAIKFPVTRITAKAKYAETQTHGFEVDLVGARDGMLVLASVKSFFGSRGVVAEHVMGTANDPRATRGYAMFNDADVRRQILNGASGRYGYAISEIQFRLYVGRFAGARETDHEERIRAWCAGQSVGAGPVTVHGLDEVARAARRAASRKTYRNNPALVAIKVLDAAGMLTNP